jgi:hypothetical protein
VWLEGWRLLQAVVLMVMVRTVLVARCVLFHGLMHVFLPIPYLFSGRCAGSQLAPHCIQRAHSLLLLFFFSPFQFFLLLSLFIPIFVIVLLLPHFPQLLFNVISSLSTVRLRCNGIACT